MKFTRTSPVTGVETTRDLDVTVDQVRAWKGGTLIQDAMPQLTPDDREWLITGTTPDDWLSLFPANDPLGQ